MALVEDEAGRDPGQHQGQVAKDGQAGEQAKAPRYGGIKNTDRQIYAEWFLFSFDSW